jgi:hypothetical protein
MQTSLMATEQRIQLPWLLSTELARYRLTDAFSSTMYLAAGVCREMNTRVRSSKISPGCRSYVVRCVGLGPFGG